ncbi:hypothetical protein SFMTTN_0878 [Sulfuriferula multivorans]|uniref:Uncharacterized protein n=1 Tax=Sulfuriferula multivorans TaxID=1559896 RepID=A0A401JBY4_9PROT|nr:plasmid mobilization relaxosome protein MobC [Sulfuriferula multivorans]GBL45074.1 hypothetical protein SFMTTN_0878 [Sulfuriferula multivorans]
MARPLKSDQVLTKVRGFRLTEEVSNALDEKCRSAGLTPSEFIRDCVLTNRTQVVARAKASKDKQRLLFLFNKASNNINQIAHRANEAHAMKKVDALLYRTILGSLAVLSQILKSEIDNVD